MYSRDLRLVIFWFKTKQAIRLNNFVKEIVRMISIVRVPLCRKLLGYFTISSRFINIRSLRFNSSASPKNTSELSTQDIQKKGICKVLNNYKETFPDDQETNAVIEKYMNLQESTMIRIGILYENATIARSSKIIETILADPLSYNNKIWFEMINSRLRTQNNRFVYSSETLSGKENGEFSFKIPSPLLSSVFRPKFTTLRTQMKDLELWEINDPSEIVNCHYYIVILDNIQGYFETQPESLNKIAMVSVIDNTDYSPTTEMFETGTGKPNLIKVNSQLAFQGIEKFLKFDTKATDEYLNSLKNSNIKQLSEIITYYLDFTNLNSHLVNDILNRISRSMSGVDSLERLYYDIKNQDIEEFSEHAHLELQYQFIPNTQKFFKKLKWWKLYLKNDNIEYLLKDYFNNNFMNSSIESYNFVRGKIVSNIQRSSASYAENDIANPLLQLKNDVVTQRISLEVQPFVYSVLTKNLINYQVPISIIAFLSYQYFDFSSNSAIALALLGWVVGFNHISKSWEIFVNKWLRNLFEDTRICLTSQCIDEGLLKELISKYEKELALTNVKKEILKNIQNNTL